MSATIVALAFAVYVMPQAEPSRVKAYQQWIKDCGAFNQSAELVEWRFSEKYITTIGDDGSKAMKTAYARRGRVLEKPKLDGRLLEIWELNADKMAILRSRTFVKNSGVIHVPYRNEVKSLIRGGDELIPNDQSFISLVSKTGEVGLADVISSGYTEFDGTTVTLGYVNSVSSERVPFAVLEFDADDQFLFPTQWNILTEDGKIAESFEVVSVFRVGDIVYPSELVRRWWRSGGAEDEWSIEERYQLKLDIPEVSKGEALPISEAGDVECDHDK